MTSNSHQYARVKIENQPGKVIIPISTEKPDIPEHIQIKWQRIVDLVARIMKVPTGLITQLTTEELQIIVASKTRGNPYKNSDKDSLGIGMFCETVAGRRKEMLVANTDDSDYWRNNPHAPFGMHSYLGVPIQWDDGELFGTFCMLDSKANQFSEEFQELLQQFKEIIETDLNHLLLQEELENKLSRKDIQIREAHHRIKNHFNLLISLIRIQSKELDDDQKTQTLLSEIENRIRTISLIHEKLYRKCDESEIPMDNYIRQLCDYLLKSLTNTHITIEYSIESIALIPEISIPCGFIISELTTNSIKHAFLNVDNPKIQIGLNKDMDNQLILTYEDNGVGLPEDFGFEKSDSIGLELIRIMVAQLKGKIEILDKNGTNLRFILNPQ